MSDPLYEVPSILGREERLFAFASDPGGMLASPMDGPCCTAMARYPAGTHRIVSGNEIPPQLSLGA